MSSTSICAEGTRVLKGGGRREEGGGRWGLEKSQESEILQRSGKGSSPHETSWVDSYPPTEAGRWGPSLQELSHEVTCLHIWGHTIPKSRCECMKNRTNISQAHWRNGI